jgi:hypothetical protein
MSTSWRKLVSVPLLIRLDSFHLNVQSHGSGEAVATLQKSQGSSGQDDAVKRKAPKI